MINRKFCRSKHDVPKEKHFAIIEFSSYTIPGDERSRTNPGHGYPESTESKADYIAYIDQKDWEKEVEKLTLRNENFVAFVVNPVTVEVTTKVKLNY